LEEKIMALTRDEILSIFKETGVYWEGHFQLASGRHSDQYCQCASLFQYADKSELICKELADAVRDLAPTVVIGPAIGAIQMAYEISRHLHVKNYFAEKTEDSFALRRGFTLTPSDRVLVAENTVTTGGSVKKVIDMVRSTGTQVVGVCSVVDRSAGKVDFGTAYRPLIVLDVPSWEKEACPLCAKGLPVTKPGSHS
jgi:orotate phosphoribosyltransferase